METFEAIESRRAVKHYDPTHKITPEEEKKLLGAALLSPTAFNIQQWRFVVVRDPEIRKQIRAVAWDQAQVTEASMLVILCGDVNSWDKDPVRYWKDAPEPVREFMIPAIKAYYDNKPQVQRDEVMRSCGIAGQTLMLAARDMGYDSCPMDGFDYEAVGKIIKLPSDHAISFMIAIGKKTQEPWPRPGQLSYGQVVLENGF
ncbi:MAG: nitroreductase family protein [Verrucomicrobia bacterium]|jgi:nitroreductase|nr:nitroreductase family protein [Verrucomicrobiota bacterium]